MSKLTMFQIILVDENRNNDTLITFLHGKPNIEANHLRIKILFLQCSSTVIAECATKKKWFRKELWLRTYEYFKRFTYE